MSEENVEVVRKSFDAIGRWDLDALLELYDSDISFEPLTGTRVETGGYRGHQGVRQYFEEADEVWDEVRPVVGQITTTADEVVVFGHVRFAARPARSTLISPAPGSSPSETERSPDTGSIRRAAKPSKPPGCRSSQKYCFGREAALRMESGGSRRDTA
jgi:ketosteroid isomerase-like protein